jgi:VanZ family protein
LPPLLYAGLIIFVSTIPSAKPPGFDVPNIDKFYHSLEYCVLALLIFRAFPEVYASNKRVVFYVILFCFGLAYGAIDETVQYFVPNRDSSVFDWMADATGYILGGALSVFLRAKLARRKAESS